MLAERRTVRSRSPPRVVLLVLLGIVLITSMVPISRGDVPTEATNPDASRTVTWTMYSNESLIQDNVSLVSGRAVLSWAGQNLAWTHASQIAANGTLASTMSANATGLGLRSNWTNYVKNPTFSDNSAWAYLNGSTDNVTAFRNGTLGAAEFRSNWSGDQILWESMDNVAANWLPCFGCFLFQNGTTYPVPKQGNGTMGIEAVAGGSSYASALNVSSNTLDWSGVNRMVLWVYVNASVEATFNLTAHAGVGGSLLTTQAQRLSNSTGWQEVVVDLNQLGTNVTRKTLYQVGLRFNAVTTFPARTWFNVDDVRLGTARVFNETAWVAQLFRKNATTTLPGSGRLSFDWCLVKDTGASSTNVSVGVAPVGTYAFVPALHAAAPGVWQTYASDVSSGTAAQGAYNITFAMNVAVNATGPYDVDVLVDNVTLVFPDTVGGTYLSNALTMGVDTQYLSLAWSGSTPAGTSLEVGIRTGNNSVPGSSGWSSWQMSSSPGPTGLGVPGAVNFQISIALGTTNASISPLLQTLTLVTRHRASAGTLYSDLYPAGLDFLRWRTFRANVSVVPRTSVKFYVGNGSSGSAWFLVPDGNLTSYTGGSRIQWRADLATSDGLATPALVNVTIVYEYLGPPTRIVFTNAGTPLSAGTVVNVTTGQYVYLGALVYDVGWHLVPANDYTTRWYIDNGTGGTAGSIWPNGTYVAGRLGRHRITVFITPAAGGATINASAYVNVTASTTSASVPFSLWDLWPVFVIAVAALLGFALYELVVRRLFAIDDVFLIAKDGRLMFHNTRRILADQDEDILSAMLTAINSFVRDTWREENSHVRRFDVGGRTTLVERGEHVYLASVYSGRTPGWAARDIKAFVGDLETHFGEAFAHWDGSPEDLHTLREVMERFVSRMRYSRRRVWKGIAG